MRSPTLSAAESGPMLVVATTRAFTRAHGPNVASASATTEGLGGHVSDTRGPRVASLWRRD
jgi:hypothetical protein